MPGHPPFGGSGDPQRPPSTSLALKRPDPDLPIPRRPGGSEVLCRGAVVGVSPRARHPRVLRDDGARIATYTPVVMSRIVASANVGLAVWIATNYHHNRG